MLFQKTIERRNKDAVMGLGEHLEELRRRVLWAIVGLVPILITSMIFAKHLVALMIQPAIAALRSKGFPAEMQNTGPLEFFSAWFKVSLIVTVVVGAPWVFIQLWKFIAPGLHAHERRFAYILAPLSSVLSLAGLAMMYFVMLPIGLNWLIDFSSDVGTTDQVMTAPLPKGVQLVDVPLLDVDPAGAPAGKMWFNTTLGEMRVSLADAQGQVYVQSILATKHATIRQEYRLREYVELFFGLALAFALAFQTPVVVLLLGWMGIIDRAWLAKYRRHAIVLCAIIGAAITPTPDPLSMAMLQVPMYLLYELGGVLLWLMPAGKMRGEGSADAESDGPATGP